MLTDLNSEYWCSVSGGALRCTVWAAESGKPFDLPHFSCSKLVVWVDIGLSGKALISCGGGGYSEMIEDGLSICNAAEDATVMSDSHMQGHYCYLS